METTRVVGKITNAGRPVTSGWVEFLPVDGTIGNLRTAPIATDGGFTIDRAPVGRVAVGLTAIPGDLIRTALGPYHLRAFRFNSTPIRRSIPPGAESQVEIELSLEAYKGLEQQIELSRLRSAGVE
jgi:hypothetical protein